MRRRTGFFQLTIIAVYLFIFLSGCSLQKIIDIAEGKASNPRWDIEVDLDVASANLTPDALIFESVDINATLREIGINALFEKVTEDNYPAMKELGFNKGDYYLKYSLPIEVPEGLFQSDIDTQISDITNNERREYAYGCPVFPIYPLNFYELFHGKKNIGLYRWPIEQEYMTFSVTNNLATYDTSEDQDIVRKVLNVVGLRLPLLPLNACFDMNLKLDFDVNKDNSADINFRGLYLGSESKVSLIVSLYEGSTPRNQYLNEKDIIIEDISVEGKKYNFKYATRTNDSSPLIYESTDFKESVFDLGGDSAKDYTKLNFGSIKFTLRGGDSPERNILGPTATPLYVKIIARIDFGKDYSLLCDLYPMTFNLGVAEAPDLGKFTEFIDKNPNVSDPKEKIINTLSSALSLNNVGFVIDMTNDFILPLDITALFDAKTTYNINPSTKEPYDTGVSPPNGGFISYFDIDKDGSYDKFVPLSYPDPKRE
ncbi:MAG TPA: hypothetical protein PLO89_00240, partial [Spirochaetota bacterium]|nr:hypothetical protein [Spirochaetota bacterium]